MVIGRSNNCATNWKISPTRIRRGASRTITSSPLTSSFPPFPEKGGKDRVAALFEEFNESVPLKDYAVWDYDQLRAFLDGNEDIRRSYAAWITPGDVLSEVIAWLRPKQADFQQILTRYMQEELLADQYVNLEKARHESEKPIPIARVFVDLPAFGTRMDDPPEEKEKDGGLPPGFVSELLEVAAQRLDPQSLPSARGTRDDVGGGAAPDAGRFVLIGGPGQGKSTVGQFVCQLFRAALLSSKPESSFEDDVLQTLNLIQVQCRSEKFGLPTARRFPIRIELNSFAKELASKESAGINSVITYVVERIRRKTNRELSVDDFRQWLGAYPWVVIFDGLDEVPPSSNRAEVLEAIRSFRIEARDCNADLLILATTRPQGYSDDFLPSLYRHKWLAPLSTPRAMHYGRRLIEEKYKSNQERKATVLGRLAGASVQPTTARLMRSPLQVTIMATLVDRVGQPPQERWDLFRKYYNVIYDREVERGITSVLSEYRKDIDTIHKRVGLLLQIESERPGESEALLSAEKFGVVVDARLAERGHLPEQRARLCQQIVEAASTRLVFLVGKEESKVGFEIRSLQEFMAAEALMAATRREQRASAESAPAEAEAVGGDMDVRRRLRAIAPLSSWRNVFLFAAGKCSVEREDLLDTIHTICDELNETTKDELARATLAGSQLALDLLEDIPVQQQPSDASILARKALRLLDLPPSNAHARLAGQYDPLLEPVYREELSRRLELADPRQRLGAWACLMRLYDAGVAWAQEFDRRYWPDDPAEMLELLQVHSAVHSGLWASEKIGVALPKLAPSKLREMLDTGILVSGDIYERLPVWARIALSLLRWGPDMMVRIVPKLAGVQNDHFELSLVPVESRDTLALHALQEMPEPVSGWLPFISAARFNASPSRSSLVQELRSVAQHFDREHVLRAGNWSVWPLAACLGHASDQAGLLALAERAEAGELGDVEDWLAAEKRWQTASVTEDDIVYSSHQSGPFDIDIARRGYPLAAGGASASGGPGLLNVAAGLVNLHEQLSDERARNVIANWVLFILGVAGRRSRSDGRLVTLQQFRDLVESGDLSTHYLHLGCFAFLERDGSNESDLVNFVDDVGQRALTLYSWDTRPDPGLVRFLVEHFTRRPALVGILRVLAEFPADEAVLSIPTELLDPKRYDDPRYKEAAVKILLQRRRWSDDEAASLAGHINEVLAARPAFASFLDEHLRGLTPGASSDRLVLAMRRGLATSHWQAMASVVSALNVSLKHRNSRFDDARVWSELNFPPSLISVLQT